MREARAFCVVPVTDNLRWSDNVHGLNLVDVQYSILHGVRPNSTPSVAPRLSSTSIGYSYSYDQLACVVGD